RSRARTTPTSTGWTSPRPRTGSGRTEEDGRSLAVAARKPTSRDRQGAAFEHTMSDAILVLNAGSSSLKFSAFRSERGNDTLLARGQVEGIGSAPRFVLRGAAGEPVEERTPGDDSTFDHEQALALAVEPSQTRFGANRLVAAGHRVVHGGVE